MRSLSSSATTIIIAFLMFQLNSSLADEGCPAGFFNLGNDCRPCDRTSSHCTSCTMGGTLQFRCLACAPGFVLIRWMGGPLTFCKPCDSEFVGFQCNTCQMTKDSSNGCTSCKPGYELVVQEGTKSLSDLTYSVLPSLTTNPYTACRKSESATFPFPAPIPLHSEEHPRKN